MEKSQQSIKEHLIRQQEMHPSTTVTDILKQCYQAAYGAEHLLTDTDAARLYLEHEFDSTPARDILLCEHISDEFCRVNIAAWKHRGLPIGDLFELFAASAKPRENGKELLEGFLRDVEELLGNSVAIEEYRRAGMPAIHHSAAYREAEHPAYRVVSSRLFAAYFDKK